MDDDSLLLETSPPSLAAVTSFYCLSLSFADRSSSAQPDPLAAPFSRFSLLTYTPPRCKALRLHHLPTKILCHRLICTLRMKPLSQALQTEHTPLPFTFFNSTNFTLNPPANQLRVLGVPKIYLFPSASRTSHLLITKLCMCFTYHSSSPLCFRHVLSPITLVLSSGLDPHHLSATLLQKLKQKGNAYLI